MNNNPIGILDSGVGGLSIWKEIVSLLPNESTIYIADSKNCPYGARLEKEIYELSRRLVQLLLEKNCKLIVVACNTITVSCLDKLRVEFPNIPIIGTVPVIKTASERSKNKRIGILSTTRTADSEYQKNLIKQFAGDLDVVNIGTDTLVPLIEVGKVPARNASQSDAGGEDLEKIIEEVVEPFKRAQIDTLVLGCSHFPFIKPQIQQILGSNVQILDSGAAIARQTRRILENNDILSDGKKPTHNFYTTGNEKEFRKVISKLDLPKLSSRTIRQLAESMATSQ